VLDRVLREAASRFGDRPALAVGDASGGRRSMSYLELDLASDVVAAGLRDLGVCEGDVVAVVLPTGFDYVVSYLGIVKAGAICAGINPRLTAPERAALIDRVRPALVIDGALPAGDPAAAPELPEDPERAVAIVFTSGSTGLPKGALFRSRQLRAIARIDLGADAADRWGGGGAILATTQLPHIGVMTKLGWYLQTGSTMWMLGRWRADDVLQLVADTGMRSIGGVAPQIALLLRSPLLGELDMSAVDTLVVGGAMSPPALVREARRRFGARYSIRYSSTESGGVGLATAFDAGDEEALHTIGRPRPGVDARIVGEASHDGGGVPDELPDGEIGELALRSAAQMDGYWGDPAATAEAIRGGWLYTGDLARRDATGCYHLVGRRKEMYIRGGYNVAPAEVEAVLGDHPALLDVAVAPRADDVMGEIGVAVLVIRPGNAAPSLGELRDFAAGRLAAWKLPEATMILDELPLNAMSKLDRPALARAVEVP